MNGDRSLPNHHATLTPHRSTTPPGVSVGSRIESFGGTTVQTVHDLIDALSKAKELAADGGGSAQARVTLFGHQATAGSEPASVTASEPTAAHVAAGQSERPALAPLVGAKHQIESRDLPSSLASLAPLPTSAATSAATTTLAATATSAATSAANPTSSLKMKEFTMDMTQVCGCGCVAAEFAAN